MSLDVVYTISSTATGGGRDGHVKSATGRIDLDTRPPKEMGGNGEGTNPEELIAAAHAGCFAMALAFALQKAGLNPTSLAVDAAVSLDPDGDGFKVSKSALTLVAEVPGVEKAKFDELAEGAKKGCPISKLLNAEITLDATLKA